MQRAWPFATLILIACKTSGTSAVDAGPATPDAPDAQAGAHVPSAPDAASRVAIAQGTVVTRGLVQPLAMVFDKKYVYVGDGGGKTVSRAPRDGGALEVLATGQGRPLALALVGDGLVWLDSPENALGEVRSVRTGNTKAFPIHVLRAGAMFTSFSAVDGDVFLAEDAPRSMGIVTRVVGPTASRLAEIEGSPRALAADKSHVFLVTRSLDGALKLRRIAKKTGVVETYPLPKGEGFRWLSDFGDSLVGNGELDGKVGLFRIPKEGAAPTMLAAVRVKDGNVVVRGGMVWFVDTEAGAIRRVEASQRVGDGGPDASRVLVSPALSHASALAVDDGSLYVATDGPADEASTSGAIVRFAY